MRPKLGIGVFIRKEGKILLGKRRSETHGHGEWSLPGGHLEKWESFEKCCSREVFEETGLDIRNIESLSFTNDFFPDADLHYVTLYFTADYAGGELVNREPQKCEGWEWFDLKNLPEPLFCGIEEIVSKNRIF
ncbi:NUDIX domain-containing protein [bacterium]|nr:MAG: NUDIX domain-containing protein [bacterium]